MNKNAIKGLIRWAETSPNRAIIERLEKIQEILKRPGLAPESKRDLELARRLLSEELLARSEVARFADARED